MRGVRAKGVAGGAIMVALAIIAIGAMPPTIRAQGFHVSVGPAMRALRMEDFYGGAEQTWDALAIQASWSARLSPRLRLLLGAGAVAGESIVEQAIMSPAPETLDLTAPCLEGYPCPPQQSTRTILGGSLSHARVGLGFEEEWFFAAAGVVAARSPRSDPGSGVGGFAELRVRPLKRLRALSVGLLAYEVSPAPGSQRAVVMPMLGMRF